MHPDCFFDLGCPHTKLCKRLHDCVGRHGYKRVITDHGEQIVPVVLSKGDKDKRKRAQDLYQETVRSVTEQIQNTLETGR